MWCHVMQQSMEVPQTPLHTSRVLKEEKDVWEDVKVNLFSPSVVEFPVAFCLLFNFHKLSNYCIVYILCLRMIRAVALFFSLHTCNTAMTASLLRLCMCFFFFFFLLTIKYQCFNVHHRRKWPVPWPPWEWTTSRSKLRPLRTPPIHCCRRGERKPTWLLKIRHPAAEDGVGLKCAHISVGSKGYIKEAIIHFRKWRC